MKKLRVVFAGTPDFSVPSLQTLINRSEIEVVCVYTRPDSRTGRGQKLVPSPIKKAAKNYKLFCMEIKNFSTPEAQKSFESLKPDLLVVAAFGIILPKSIIEVPKLAINVHASLLPRWRGAAPIQRCILEGDNRTGISIMRIVEKLDAGPVILQKSCAIGPNETNGSLHGLLANLGGTALNCALDKIINDSWSEISQSNENVTYASKITREDCEIDWRMTAENIDRKIRSLHPKPGASAVISTIKVKIISAQVSDLEKDSNPGKVIISNKNRLVIATGNGNLQINFLQVPGKKASTAATFINGYRKFL